MAPSIILYQLKQKTGQDLVVIDEVVSGGASGMDKSGEIFAMEYALDIKRFPADWAKYGRRAGPIRNRQMAEYADALFLVWDGQSKGSASMKAEMTKLNKPVYEVIMQEVRSFFPSADRIQSRPRTPNRESGTREMDFIDETVEWFAEPIITSRTSNEDLL